MVRMVVGSVTLVTVLEANALAPMALTKKLYRLFLIVAENDDGMVTSPSYLPVGGATTFTMPAYFIPGSKVSVIV